MWLWLACSGGNSVELVTEEPVDSEVPVVDDTGTEKVPGVPQHVPVFWVELEGSIPTGEKADGTLAIIRPTTDDHDDVEDDPRLLEVPIGIEVHGSSSQGYPKQGYRIELRDEDGEDANHEILGLPKGSDFVLHAPYSDKTLIRNALAYQMARDVSPRWSVRTRFVELYDDGRYRGVYLLVERVRQDNDRVDIAENGTDGDITGGYIVRIEQHRNEGWDTERGTKIDYHYPRYEDITGEQDAYLKAWFEEFEAALSADDFASTYDDWVVAEDWMDHFILNEMTHNIDAYRLSAYLYKDSEADGGRLHAGPVWDFDRAYGNVNYCDCENIEGFIIDDLTNCGEGYQFPYWWKRLLSDPAFQDALRCRYEEHRAGPLSDANIDAAIDEMVAELEHAEPRDHEKWETIGEYVDPNSYVGDSYTDEVEWLREWQHDRAAWLDANMPGTCN
ncbi:MAG: hypothetical protein GY913_12810 [Proteobacteria bacterium]|nr:hypothetical protein [Pseudomonadota bacterium]